MEELKKKVEALSAQNALFVFGGISVLVLLLFLCANQLSISFMGDSESFAKGTDLLTEMDGFGKFLA